MNNKQFAEKALFVAAQKTLYVKGGFGLVLNKSGKARAIASYDYNKKRADMINAASNDTFAFDCCGLVKGILWGFDANTKKVYGGADYKSNGVDDLNEKGLFNQCANISDDMSTAMEGDFLYMSGHCGIYIGGGKVVESSPAWENGVQITKLTDRKWKAHGRLKYITYTDTVTVKPNLVIPAYYLRLGSKGMEVNKLQRCLNYVLGSSLSRPLTVDGIFGPLTLSALRKFQSKNGLISDGIYGPKSQKKLREVIK